MKRLYIVQKYVIASNPTEALKKEKKQKPDEVFINAKWFENSEEFIGHIDKTK